MSLTHIDVSGPLCETLCYWSIADADSVLPTLVDHVIQPSLWSITIVTYLLQWNTAECDNTTQYKSKVKQNTYQVMGQEVDSCTA